MNFTLLRKLKNDLARNSGQFTLMALAVLVSVFALATLANALTMLDRTTRDSYLATNPAQATIETDGARELPTQAQLASLLAANQSDAKLAALAPAFQSERRVSLLGRITDPAGQWYPLVLFVIEDFRDFRVGKAGPDSGEWPPATGTMLLERTAMTLIGRSAGQRAAVLLPGIGQTEVRLSGTAHDPGLAPAWQERTVYGYISQETAAALWGKAFPLDELKLVFPIPQASAAEIRDLANRTALVLAKAGYVIHEIQVPSPRTHPHQNQMNTIIGIFLAFSLLSLVLAGVLLASLMRGLIQREKRLIGIMKTLGAGPGILLRHYLAIAFLPALAASLIALPLGMLSGRALAGVMASLLNLGEVYQDFTALPVILPLLAGLLIPALFALIPVRLASRASIREALAGPAAPPPRTRSTRFRLPRLLAMAGRNLGRRRGQLALNLGLLAIAGGLFIAALDIGTGYRKTLELAALDRAYDIEIRLDRTLPTDQALAGLLAIKGVTAAESWSRQAAYPAGDWDFPVTSQYPDKGHGSFTLRSLPVESSLLNLKTTAGDLTALRHWPATEELVPIALNQNAAAFAPGWRLGDRVELLIDGKRQAFRLAAMIREIGPATAWIPQAGLDRIPGLTARRSNAFYVRLDPGLAATDQARAIFAACEQSLVSRGATVELALPQAEFTNALGSHVWILIYSLALMALVIGVIGLLGLSAAMGSSVLERTREIAVMRSIGATPATIRTLVLGEAGLQALLGLALALALSWPLSRLLGNMIGMMSFRIPLETVLEPAGLLIWITILGVGGLAASLLAALRAASATIPQGLAYE